MLDLSFLYLAIMGYALAATAWSIFRRRLTPTATIFGIDDIAFWGTVGSGLLGMFKGKSKNDAEKAAREAYNQWLKDRKQTADDIIGNLASRGVDVYGPQVTTHTQEGTQTGTQSSRTRYNEATSTRPQITAEYQPMEAKLRALIMGQLGQPQQVTEAEKANMLQRIQEGAAPGLQAARNAIARMNLGGTSIQAANLVGPAQRATQSQMNQYLGTTVPETERARQAAIRAEAAGTIGAFGKGEVGSRQGTSATSGTTTGYSSGTSTSTAPPDFSALFSMLAPPQPQASMKTGYNPYLSGGQDLIEQLTALYAGRQKGGSSGYGGYGG